MKWGGTLDGIVHTVTVGGLLHDVGEILYRGGLEGSSHGLLGAGYIKRYIDDRNIIDCIRFHHRQELESAMPDSDSPAYIVYIADNISSGAGGRETGETPGCIFQKERLLESIFNLLNNKSGKAAYLPGIIEKNVRNPECFKIINPVEIETEYRKILDQFTNGLSGVCFEPKYINSLIELCESCMSYIPSTTSTGGVSDISLYDHSKITAALAACIALYLKQNKRTNYKDLLYENKESFYDEKAFCLFSIDISGIQQFIYTISSKGALKGLRSRSFYLEILLENIADEVLDVCSLSRANLLYTGGGHAYMLLPNAEGIMADVQNAIRTINGQLMKKFGTGLFAACGFQACSANELMSKTDDPESYTDIFRSVSAQISAIKLRRYSPDDIRKLNSSSMERGERECSVCGASDSLTDFNDDTICEMCLALADISNELIKKDVVFTILRSKPVGKNLPLFSAVDEPRFLCPMSVDAVREILKNDPDKVVRIYGKNLYRTGLSLSTKLWMGDYASQNNDGSLKTFAQLAECSEGIKRIGVLKADVDNLGTAFVKGFVREMDPENKYKYVTVSRTSTLSRNLSLFFKYHINYLMENPEYSLTGKSGKRNLVIVYSGGDDLFIVGAWDEVLSAAVDLHKAFELYTGGALTLSAGFSVFESKYPIVLMAQKTAELEERAKRHRYNGNIKNSISLFGLEPKDGLLTDNHTYDWETFNEKVLGEKYGMIEAMSKASGDYGNSFFYNILYLIIEAGNKKINIARLAYLLARHEPGPKADEKLKAAYAGFTSSIYKWVLEPEDRRQLITAMIIYIYTIRQEEGNLNE